LKQEDKTTSMV